MTILCSKSCFQSSSSSCYSACTDPPDPLTLHVSIVHHSRAVFQIIYCIGRELLHIGSSSLSCLYLSMCQGPQHYITYEFVFTSPAVFCISGSSNIDSFRDGW